MAWGLRTIINSIYRFLRVIAKQACGHLSCDDHVKGLGLGCKSRTWYSNPFRIRIFLFLSHSFGFETINTFIHSEVPSKTIPYSKRKWAKSSNRLLAKCIPVFRPKRRKTLPNGAAHTYMACIREYPPPPGLEPSPDLSPLGLPSKISEKYPRPCHMPIAPAQPHLSSDERAGHGGRIVGVKPE